MADSSPAMTVREVAAFFNVHEKTVYRLAQRGQLPGFKVSGAWRFQRNDLDGWIAAQKREVQRARGSDSPRLNVTAENRRGQAKGGSAAR